MIEPLFCTFETNRRLYINNTAVKKLFLSVTHKYHLNIFYYYGTELVQNGLAFYQLGSSTLQMKIIQIHIQTLH